MDACREQGVEDPTWRWDGGFVIVTFKRPTYIHTQKNKINKEGLSGEITQEPTNLRSTSAQLPAKYRSSSEDNHVYE